MRLTCILFICVVEFQFHACFRLLNSCPTLYLQNGRVRFSSSGKIATFSCNKPYVLVGEEQDLCVNGNWSSSLHACAKKNCPKLTKLYHGTITYGIRKTTAKVVCDSNFTLIGSPVLLCGDNGWNFTSLECMANDYEKFKQCSFEIDDPEHCQWLKSPSSDYKWIVYPSDLEEETVYDYPLVDHTLEPHPDGHYLLLIRKTSSMKMKKQKPKGVTDNKEAKFISPLFPARTETNETFCLLFYYYTNGPNAKGVLKIKINNDTTWENDELVQRKWTKQVINLQNQFQPFRITVVGVGLSEFQTFTAIDDLKIAKGSECLMSSAFRTTVKPEMTSETLSVSRISTTGSSITESSPTPISATQTIFYNMNVVNNSSEKTDDHIYDVSLPVVYDMNTIIKETVKLEPFNATVQSVNINHPFNIIWDNKKATTRDDSSESDISPEREYSSQEADPLRNESISFNVISDFGTNEILSTKVVVSEPSIMTDSFIDGNIMTSENTSPSLNVPTSTEEDAESDNNVSLDAIVNEEYNSKLYEKENKVVELQEHGHMDIEGLPSAASDSENIVIKSIYHSRMLYVCYFMLGLFITSLFIAAIRIGHRAYSKNIVHPNNVNLVEFSSTNYTVSSCDINLPLKYFNVENVNKE